MFHSWLLGHGRTRSQRVVVVGVVGAGWWWGGSGMSDARGREGGLSMQTGSTPPLLKRRASTRVDRDTSIHGRRPAAESL